MTTSKVIYLDYASATPVDPIVLAAMQPYFTQKFYNPSATYLAGRSVAKDIEASRASVAKWLAARPAEIVFTAGGTEANNLAIQGIMQAHRGANIVTSAIEHESVLKPAGQYNCKIVKVLPNGLVDLKDFARQLDDKTVLVSIMYANNEIGTIEPLREISKILETIRRQRLAKGNKLPLYFHSDACQAAGYLDLHVNRLGVDLLTINSGKIYGPKQSGCLFIKTGVRLKPQILGGGQQRGLRSGTENVASIVGLSKALDLVQSRRQEETARLGILQKTFTQMVNEQIPDAKINGSTDKRLPNNVHITFPGQDNERLMMQLDEQGIICAVGSACSASSDEPSHVLKAIGLSSKDARSSLRFSLGRSTTDGDIKRTVEALKQSL